MTGAGGRVAPRGDAGCTVRHAGAVVVAICLIAAANASRAADAPPPETPAAPPGLFGRDTLTGDWGGWRKRLEDHGVQLGADYVGETLGNPTGGRSRAAVYEGRLEFFATVDLGKAVGWQGALFHTNAYQIHGRGLSAAAIGNLATVSNIEADRATRLYALWLQQDLYDHTLSIRGGQIAADDEFVVSQYGATFINSTFGWPVILGSSLPGGGAAYPAATPGLRVKGAAAPDLDLSAAVFTGDPAGPGLTSAAPANTHGTDFRLGGAALIMTEAAYQIDLDPEGARLPGTLKLGAWYDTGRFADQRVTSSGLSLADPSGAGDPATHEGNYGGYAIADLKLWHEPDAVDQGLGVFLRVAGSPADRNLVDFYVDAGMTYTGLVPGRDADIAGLAIGFAHVSGVARAADRDAASFTGTNRPVRDYEAVLELTYQAQIAPWWIVQPDFQFILHPGGQVPETDDPAEQRPIPNAIVLGLRTGIVF